MPEFAPSADSPRLLVVDDSTDERRALSALLAHKGYEVDEAADGTSAMLLLKSRGCDLLLLDLQMPGVDGFDILAFVQKTCPDLPVILLSGMPLDQIGTGINKVPGRALPPLLLKPIDPEQLIKVVELKLAGELP